MTTYICIICGDAYLGEIKPKNCPFCGAREVFIKNGHEAVSIADQKYQLSEVSKKNLIKAYGLEKMAVAIYNCMANKTADQEIKAMYKRLAKVELEHASIITKLLDLPIVPAGEAICDETDINNFRRTIKLEEDAFNLYVNFAKEAEEQNIKILFIALSQAEEDHVKLIKNYL